MINRLFNMASGPVELTRSVDTAMVGQFAMAHHSSFRTVEAQLRKNLGRLLGTEGEIIITHGSIRTGLDVAVANVVQPGDKVLVLSNGYWGKLFGEIVEAYRGQAVIVEFDPTEPISEHHAARALDDHPDARIVTLTDVETTTGLRNDAAGVGRVIRRHGALYILDTACSAGNMPVASDEWGVDVGITGSQKGFSAPAGLAILSISPRAKQWVENRREPVYGWYHNLRFHWKEPAVEEAIASGTRSPFSPATLLYFSLAASVNEILDIGVERFFEQHRKAAMALRHGLRAAGLKLLIEDDKVASTTVVAAWYPDGVNDAAARRWMDEKYDLFIGGNLGAFAGKSFRIGLMSPPQIQLRQVLSTLTCTICALGDQGIRLDLAVALSQATRAYGGEIN